jgi:hypothetical protein
MASPAAQTGSCRRRPWLWGGLAGLGLLVLAGAGCCLFSRPGTSEAGSKSNLCTELRAAPRPTLVPARPFAPPASELPVHVAVATDRIRRELNARVPVVLADVRGQHIGKPGRVSYMVRRSSLRLGLYERRLVVSTDVSAEVEVCKPLGPLCVTYGRCRPGMHARASVPLLLQDDYNLGPSQVDVQVTRPCFIAGFDATPEIRRQARQQAAAVKQRIDASLPPLRPHVMAVWELVQSPLELSDAACLLVTPQTLTLTPPELVDGALVASVGLGAKLQVQSPCAQADAGLPRRPLSAPRTADSLPERGTLRVAVLLDYGRVSDALTKSLSNGQSAQTSGLAATVTAVRAQGAEFEQQPVVALQVEQQCGSMWLVAEPWYDPKSRMLALRGLRVVTPELSEAANHQAEALAGSIERQASLTVPAELEQAARALETTAERALSEQAEQVELEVWTAPMRVAAVVVAREGLAVIGALETSVRVSVK